jgi:hypothetical protein
MLSPEATFDALLIADSIQQKLGDAAEGEIHLFAYLACLLSIFEKWPASLWLYTFAGLQNGAPFSAELHNSIASCLNSGDLVAVAIPDTLRLTSVGCEKLTFMRGLGSLSPRTRYLEAACSTLRSLPVGLIRTAMGMEPGLRPAIIARSARSLLTGAALDQLYDHFDAVSKTVGNQARHLIIPASVWLSYLFDTARKTDRMLSGTEVQHG